MAGPCAAGKDFGGWRPILPPQDLQMQELLQGIVEALMHVQRRCVELQGRGAITLGSGGWGWETGPSSAVGARMTADPSYTGTLTEGRGGPTVFRIRLGAQLRRLREARHITREDAGYAIRSSDSKISRLELGRARFKERDVGDLLPLYWGEDERERAMMLSV